MFSSWKTRLLVGVYIFLLLSVPVGAYLASKVQNPNVAAKNTDRTISEVNPSPLVSAKKQLIDATAANPTPIPIASEVPTAETNFGPVLDFYLQLEGRPANKQTAKIFAGIAEGEITTNPKYLLTFLIDLPADGHYPNLSLAGLTTNSKYTLYIKGPAQIAVASTFTMSAFTTHLNDSLPLTALSGDLNEDNAITEADLTIAKTGNLEADFNLDGIVNSIDFAFINKNINKIGASGLWVSPPPKPEGGTNPQGGEGYWFWMPKL